MQREAGEKRRVFAPLRTTAFRALVGLVAAITVVAVGCSGGQEKGSASVPTAPPEEPAVETGSASVPTAPPEEPAVETGRKFLASLAAGQYDQMWQMLAAASRDRWGEESAFEGFLAHKFGGAELSFSVGEAAAQASWRNVETGALYEEAMTVPLRLKVNGAEAQEFSLSPLVLAKEGGRWRVASEGPAGRRAPVLPLPPSSPKTLAVPILAYHHVRREWPQDYQERTMTVTTAAFAQQLAYLRDSGYQTVTLRELANALFYGLPLPEKPVVLTFDDGYENAFSEAFPLLQQYGFIGTFALPTGLIGGQGYLTWGQAKAMSEAGMEFVSHSVNHIDLGGVPAEEARAEVRDSRAALETSLGQPMQVLVYPYGEPFAHGSPEQQLAVVELLRQEGYAVAVTNPLPGEWPNITQKGDLPYELRRVVVSGGLPLNRFAARLDGNDVR